MIKRFNPFRVFRAFRGPELLKHQNHEQIAISCRDAKPQGLYNANPVFLCAFAPQRDKTNKSLRSRSDTEIAESGKFSANSFIN
ncbi:hypothetical protein [Lacimicrobium alkaliphilum]|uniref:hypothetical protein n=1 Tax=Lacimicrobium alkaliphilum TaxID=1526571 RepID=UPI0012E3E394|nr:hypothetical protein [Lacimicrobium alkaliphilum]